MKKYKNLSNRKFHPDGFTPGARKSPLDLRNYKVIEKKVLAIALPDEFQLKKGTVLNQGNVGSCVAHATASFVEVANKNDQKYSTGWIYGQRSNKKDESRGMVTSDACKILLNVGEINYETFPENIEVIKAIDLVNERFNKLKGEASKIKIKEYASLDKKDINKIKSWLYTEQLPILIACNVDGWYYDIYEKSMISKYNSGGHCMLLIGWNKNGWIVQNSWGNYNYDEEVNGKLFKTGWEPGLIVLSYDYPILELWAMKYEGKSEVEQLTIVKPSFYGLRSFFQNIINFFRDLFWWL